MDPRTVMELYPALRGWAATNAAANYLLDEGLDADAEAKFADSREVAVNIVVDLAMELGLDFLEPAPHHKDTSVLGYWYRRYSGQAFDEGWSIFDAEFQLDERPGLNHDGEPCMVTLIGHELQVQRCDEADRLPDDVDAWALVMNGTSDCHDLARRIIAAESPVEFSRMLNYTKGWEL